MDNSMTEQEVFDIKVPDMGESIVDATISHWIKHEGDPVAVGEPLVELETAKVNLEVSAQQGGILSRILHRESEDVQVGEVIGLIAANSSSPAPAAPEAVLQASQPAPVVVENPAGRSAEASSQPRVTPVARRVAQDQGVDLSHVAGTGPGGRVTKTNVLGHIPGDAAPQPVQVRPAPVTNSTPASISTGRGEERIKMSRRRRTIAERLVQAQQTAAMLTTFNELDMGAIMALRARHNEAFQARYGVKLGITSFFIKAAIGALKAFPLLNAEIQGDEIVYKHYFDIGVAVAAPGGLVVPVIRDADRLSFAETEQRIGAFAAKASSDTLTLEDLRGGTFTITNGGVFGSLMSTPILTPPQVGILGLHKIEKRPVVVDDQVVIRQMMYVALTYDHRLVDGREAVQFLARVKELAESPESLLLEG
jgi:2-oxoglutarate dehydrogenase E2 component (dihydrolipoamide succinyltransferase)